MGGPRRQDTLDGGGGNDTTPGGGGEDTVPGGGTTPPDLPTQPAWPSYALPSSANERFVTPTGGGAGTSWADGASLSQIPALITALASTGGVIWVQADNGAYTATSQISMTSGPSSEANRVYVCGINTDMTEPSAVTGYARMEGTRTDWTLPTDSETTTDVRAWTAGNSLFRWSGSTCRYVTFRNLYFKNIGIPFEIGLDDGANYCHFTQLYFYNVRYGWLCNSSTRAIKNATFRKITAIGFSKGFVQLRADSNNNTFEYFDINSGRQDYDDFSAGFKIGQSGDTCNTNAFNYIVVRNCHDSDVDADGYWNGDGFSDESGCYDNTFSYCFAYGCTDSGFDCKGTRDTFENCIAQDNKRNFRVWGIEQEYDDCWSLYPNLRGTDTSSQLHVGIYGDSTENARPTSADAVFRRLRMYDAAGETGRIACRDYDGVGRFVDCYYNDTAITAANVSSLMTLDYETAAATTGALLFGLSASDTTAPTITSSASKSVVEFNIVDLTLTADESVTWDIPTDGTTTGPDRAMFRLDQPIQGTCKLEWYRNDPAGPEVGKGYAAPEDADANNVYLVTVRARDAVANETRQTISVTVTAGSVVATRYIAPAAIVALGDGTGEDINNPGSLSLLNAFIGSVGAGGEVHIIADQGAYNFSTSGGATTFGPITINQGGTVGNPVVIKAVTSADVEITNDDTANYARFTGQRTSWTLPGDSETVTDVGSWTIGGTVFVLASGADYLTFKKIYFDRHQVCFDADSAGTTGITIDYCYGYNLRRFWDGTESGSGPTHVDTTISNCDFVGYSKALIRFAGNSSGITIDSCIANGGRQSGDDFSRFLQFDGTAHDYTVVDCVARNHVEENGAGYWQGDSFEDNNGCYNGTYTRCEAYGNADGGFDLKSDNTTLTDCIAEDCRRNFRLWGNPMTLTTCESRFAVKRANASAAGDSGSTQNFHVRGQDTTGVSITGDVTCIGCKFLLLLPTQSYSVTGATRATPGVVTVTPAHPLTASGGDYTAYFSGVGGMTELNDTFRRVRYSTSNTTLGLRDRVSGGALNTSGFTAYTSGGSMGLMGGGWYGETRGHQVRLIDCEIAWVADELDTPSYAALSTDNSPHMTSDGSGFADGSSIGRWFIALSSDVTAPTITSTNTASVAAGATLSKSLTADEACSWVLTDGSANFEILYAWRNSPTLRFLNNGTKTAGSYVAKVKAKDAAGNLSAEQTITVTVT